MMKRYTIALAAVATLCLPACILDEVQTDDGYEDDEAAGQVESKLSQSRGWDPGLTTRRIKARDLPFLSYLDGSAQAPKYSLVAIQEHGSEVNTAPYNINVGGSPFMFGWTGSGTSTAAHLIIDTNEPAPGSHPSYVDPHQAYTFLGFIESDSFNGSAQLPHPATARWRGRLWRNGPFHDGSTAQEDGRVLVAIAWDEPSGRYIVEMNLHSGNRRPSWRTNVTCAHSGTHLGSFTQYLVLGGTKWNLPAMGSTTDTYYDIKWGEILGQLRQRNDACRLDATLPANAKTLEIGAAIEVHGAVQEHLRVKDVYLSDDVVGGCQPPHRPSAGTFTVSSIDYYSNGISAYCRCPDNVAATRSYCGTPTGLTYDGTCSSNCGSSCTPPHVVSAGTFTVGANDYYSNGNTAFCRCPNNISTSRNYCALPTGQANHGTCGNHC